MKLIECYIENFGALSQKNIKFSGGLNCFLSENGSGKTTLAAFIKAMFYGFGANKKQSIDENDRKKYAPWGGGLFGGSLTFSYGGELYRIERSFGAKSVTGDEFRLVNAATGELSGKYTENIGEELFGIDEDGFLRTVFLSERILGGKISNDTIAAKLSDLTGTDGDIGDYKAASGRLDEQRKLYYKNGNKGLIADTRAELAACELKIAGLEERRRDAEATEAEILDLRLRLTAASERRDILSVELGKTKSSILRRELIEEYRAKQLRYTTEIGRKDELGRFFLAGVPTEAEINDARDAMIEAEKLSDERIDGGSSELSDLAEFFRRETDHVELAELCRKAKGRTSLSDELQSVRTKLSFCELTMKERFGRDLPDEGELTKHIKALESRGTSLLSCIMLCCIIPILALGIAVNNLIMIAAIPLAIFGIALLSAQYAKRVSAERYAKELGISEKEVLKALLEIQKEVSLHNSTVASDTARIQMLLEEIAAIDADVEKYISNYPHGKKSADEALELIREKLSRYIFLKENAELREESRKDLDMRIAFLRGRANDFLAKYPVSAADPFEEIRARRFEYGRISETVGALYDECRAFRDRHGITDSELESLVEAASCEPLELELAELNTSIRELSGSIIRAESRLNTLSDELLMMDELLCERGELLDKIERYNETLEVIQSTMEILRTASKAITSRYIGPARERFEKYVSSLTGSAEGYTLDTSFVIKKLDRGASRDAESYSRGTRDLHSLALRLALADSLWGGEVPFLVLDDPFISFDNARLAEAKALIRELSKEKQIIYFTCSEERKI